MGRFLETLLTRENRERKNGKGAKAALIVLIALFLLLIAFNLDDFAQRFHEIGDYLRYKFIRRALIVGVLVSLCAALLGVTLVLKRYSMIGDGLSHVGFGALSIAASMGFVSMETLPVFLPETVKSAVVSFCACVSSSPLPFTLIVVVAMAFIILRMSENSAIRGDAAIALLSTAFLAIGVFAASCTSGMNVDVMNYMFGSILAMGEADVVVSLTLSGIVLLVFVLFYRRIFAVTFDESFARATGTRVNLYNMLIALLTAVTIVIGMRMMGTMLISSLIIFPALTSMRVFSRFKTVLISAALVSVVCFVIGIMLSCLYSIPAGAAIVLVNLFVFFVFSLIEKVRN